MIHHQHALLVDLLDVEVLEIVDDDEVRQIARGNGAPVVQQEVPGGVVAGHLDGGDGVGPQSRWPSSRYSRCGPFPAGRWGACRRCRTCTARRTCRHSRGIRASRFRAAVPSRIMMNWPRSSLAMASLQIVALVVGVDAGGDVGVEVVALTGPGRGRRSSCGGPGPPRSSPPVWSSPCDDAHKVHHLRQALDPGVVIEAVDGPVVQHRPRTRPAAWPGRRRAA